MQLLQLIQGSAFVRSRCWGSSYIEHNGPAEPRIVAGAAELVENGPRATVVAFEHRAKLLGLSRRFFSPPTPNLALLAAPRIVGTEGGSGMRWEEVELQIEFGDGISFSEPVHCTNGLDPRSGVHKGRT